MSLPSDLLFVAQWTALRAWAGALPGDVERPSNLEGWSVPHLLAHLVQIADSLAAIRPAPPGTTPLSLGEYVARYADRTQETAERARSIAVSIAGSTGTDIGSAMDATYEQAARTLGALGSGDPVVIAPRGPIRLPDFVDTRLIEVVVHSDDLARSLPDLPAPRVLGSARGRVATVLRAVLADRAEDPEGALRAVAGLGDAVFIDYATGRVKVPDELAEATGRVLPIL